MDAEASQHERALRRFRRWGAVLLGLAVLGYLVYAVARGFSETTAALQAFRWELLPVILCLTLLNYSMRFFKWHYLLHRLGVRVPLGVNLWVFGTGLAMVLSPGKAGEIVKPYYVGVATGAPMARTLPALVTERATDALAVVGLASLGVSTYYAKGTWLLVLTGVLMAAGLAAFSLEPVTDLGLAMLRRVPLVRRIADKLQELVTAMRTCVAPTSLAITLVASVLAWGAECLGYWLVFRGLDVSASLDVSTFLYASATVFGGPSPGGLGISDGTLVEGALRLVDGLDAGRAVAAALLIRLATLWLGVGLGAVALLRIDQVTGAARGPRPPSA